MSCNITEKDIKKSKFKFGNISLILKDGILWVHEENFLMQMSEEDALAYVMLVHNAKKVCLYYKSLREIEEFAFDGLMNFLSNKNGYYTTGGLFGHFAKVGDLIKPEKDTFMSKGSFPIELLQIGRKLLAGKEKEAKQIYNHYLSKLSERKHKYDLQHEVVENIKKNNVEIIKQWETIDVDSNDELVCFIVEYNNDHFYYHRRKKEPNYYYKIYKIG